MPAVLPVQLACNAALGTDSIEKKILTPSVRLFLKLGHSLLLFMMSLAVAQGSITAKERGQGRNQTPRCKGRKRLERASPLKGYDCRRGITVFTSYPVSSTAANRLV